jgi:AcrR family transcriptional regulator
MIKAIRQPRRSQADRTATARAALVAAATVMLSEQGYARATSSAIAAEAGLSTGALHHHFAAKEDLFIAVLDDATARVIALFTDIREERSANSDMAATLIKSLWSVYGEEAYWAVWEINIAWRSDKALRKQLTEHRKDSRERMNAAIRDNAFLSDRTKDALLSLLPFILSAMRGMFLETFATHDEAFFRGQLEILASLLRAGLSESGVAARRGRVAATK